MRKLKLAMALTALPLLLGGCSALGLGGDSPGATATAPVESGEDWMRLAAGDATPSPTPSRGKATATADPTVSAPAPDPSCTKIWPRTDPVFIPVEITPGAGSLKVEWPTQYDSDYRVAAVPQQLVSGRQPEPVWKTVAAGTGCTVSTTITGLTSGAAYIVWLDAPNTGYNVDGSRHLYSGRSGVVYPN
ncbi:hypothetical protein ACTI_24850 [Actinoplanes sp. OR16]|uniref:hypothetical protein n=1 Tax=Actinoplanes sp. OR16 TaxID=946334 RepID=UPI000F6C5AD1|nr:hypothetical protein [Actinoplanes sp. OR16]BBH65800.1 hypothetical protein ACTI_24850 [Actinoplanes sp. OR16]